MSITSKNNPVVKNKTIQHHCYWSLTISALLVALLLGNNLFPNTSNAASANTKANRTIMIYMIGSDLESQGGLASADIGEMVNANIPNNVNVILECGGAKKWNNNIVPDGKVTRYAVKNHNLKKLKDLGKISMVNKGALSDFITFTASNYPAEYYTLVLWDHGGGVPAGFGIDELGDINERLTSYEIRDELNSAKINFDVVIFDACKLGTLEMGMALHKNAEYMIGAESNVVGNGLYYTNWLEIADKDCQKFCEKAAKDYIQSIHDNNEQGSMSLVRLDNIDDVYNKYVAYISSIKSESPDSWFENYAKARFSFNDFNDANSIDLVSLAMQYHTKKSSRLQNAVTNSVVFTESDYDNGHGITIYSPTDYSSYSLGRQAFKELNYDKEITDFYDEFLSKILSRQDSDDVKAYGGEWYNAEYSDSNANKTKTYTLKTELINGKYSTVALSQNDWDIIEHVELQVAWTIDNGKTYHHYGSDYQHSKDSDGRLIFYKPNKWQMINGHCAEWVCNSYFEDKNTGDAEITGFIPIMLNGNKEAALYVVYNNDYQNGIVVGYVDYNIANSKYLSTEVHGFEDGDTIDLAFRVQNENGSIALSNQKDPVKASDIKLTYGNFRFTDKVKVFGRYIINDVYGNKYITDYCPLANK